MIALRYNLCLVSLLAATLTARAQLPGVPSSNEGAPRPAILQHAGFDQNLNAQVPLDQMFHDESGHSVKLSDFVHDKPVILCFAYYECPMLCTLVLNGIAETCKQMKLEMGKDYQVITVGIDPTEKPELAARKKQNYLRQYAIPGMESGWHFLTTDEGPARAVANAVGFKYEYDPVSDQFAHASGIMVLTPDGHVSHYFYGVLYPNADVRLALVEASNGKIGNPVDQLLMFCFHYDPVTGQYSAAIMNMVRLGGVLTLVLLTAFFWAMNRLNKARVPVQQPSSNMTA